MASAPPPYQQAPAGAYPPPAGAYSQQPPPGAYPPPAGAYNQGAPAGAYPPGQAPFGAAPQPSYQTHTTYNYQVPPQQKTIYVQSNAGGYDRGRGDQAAEDCCLLACCWATLCCCLLNN
ncbi:unnamed protein product [Owenia fusiformis]|uniref:Uncharacterized protein n=1 Tax=Owenia fusiformis TaxID=6347 RepID=A0A8J1UK53_OWEFU|nr:unnamed protein product [Owenia fusiformis]